MNQQTLHLDKIDLCDLSPLPKLPSLETLNLSSNRLHMICDVTRLFPSLEVLDVRWNSLASVQAVRGLKGLNNLCEIQVEGNGVCQESNEWVMITLTTFCALFIEDPTFLYSYRKDLHSALPNLEIIDGVC